MKISDKIKGTFPLFWKDLSVGERILYTFMILPLALVGMIFRPIVLSVVTIAEKTFAIISGEKFVSDRKEKNSRRDK